MAIPVVLPEIALEATPATIVAPPTATLNLAIESDPESLIEDVPMATKPLPGSGCNTTTRPDFTYLPTSPTKPASIGHLFVIPEATTPVASVRRRSEPIHRTIPLLVARLVRLDGQIEEISDHEREVLVTRIESDEHEIETLRAKGMWVEAQVAVLWDLLGIFRVRIIDLEF
ncbi:hypothetical protein Tco_0516824 [Tanacetum coccineum]